jgi:hypothetical protein
VVADEDDDGESAVGRPAKQESKPKQPIPDNFDPATFVFKGGKFQGHAVGAIDPIVLTGWLKWCNENAKTGEAVDMVTKYLEKK